MKRIQLYVRPWLPAFFLLAITVLAYIPAIRGGFIWDDDAHVTGNRLLRSAQGLWDIWAKVGPRSRGTTQYYPLTFSVFWVEYHLWQLRPLGYHLVNVLLHALNAVLVWRLLRRLRVPGALLAAAIFALHPVLVESVAWVTELKNVLSGLFYLLALRSYLRFLGIAEPGGTPAQASPGSLRFYLLAVFLFVCALASKTVTVSLPAVILLILWWKTGRIGWRNLLLVAPMLALAAGSGLLTAYVEKHQVGAAGNEWALSPVEHCLLAGRALWFYAGKLIWPDKLTFIYPRWEVSQAVWRQYLFPSAAVAALLALWILRQKLGRGPLAAALFFTGTLAPALGFLNVYFMRFSYVADHFQYLASLGVIALLAAAATQAWRRLGSWGEQAPSRAALSVAGALLLALAALTWRQGGAYKDTNQMWIDTLAKNPACWLAHNNLGEAYLDLGRTEAAASEFTAALKLKPDYVEPRANLGRALAGQGKAAAAVAAYKQALKLDPGYAYAHNDLGRALAGQGKLTAAIAEYRQALKIYPKFAVAYNNLGLALAGQGRSAEAMAAYRQALKINPNDAAAYNNLGLALAGQGRSAEAIAEFRQALKTEPNFPGAHSNLGGVLAREGKSAEAIAEYRQALKIDPNYAAAHNNLGLALAGQGKAAEAIAEYRQALKLDPNYKDAHNNLGLTLAGQGKAAEAAAEYRQVLKIDPYDAGAHNNLGVALTRQSKAAEAMAEFRQALKTDPNSWAAHGNLGALLAREGKLTEAAAEYRQALRINPNYAQAAHNLSRVLSGR